MVNECVCIGRKKRIILFYSIINTEWGIARQTDRNLHIRTHFRRLFGT
jgi:hypothetical protein